MAVTPERFVVPYRSVHYLHGTVLQSVLVCTKQLGDQNLHKKVTEASTSERNLYQNLWPALANVTAQRHRPDSVQHPCRLSGIARCTMLFGQVDGTMAPFNARRYPAQCSTISTRHDMTGCA